MRLRPRAGSSDIEDARAIAQRLDGRARSPDPDSEGQAAGYVRFGAAEEEESARGAAVAVAEPEAPEPDEPESDTDSTTASAEDLATEPVTEPDPVVEPFTEPDSEDEPPPETGEGDGDGAEVDSEDPDPGQAPIQAAEPGDAIITMPPAPSDGPSWESLLAGAQASAGARAGMLLGPEGALLATSGDWPAVGAAAIAGKLLPLVTVKLAEGGMVPVKMAGQALTAWHLEHDGATLTVAFLADKALAPDLRPEIDLQLSQGRYTG